MKFYPAQSPLFKVLIESAKGKKVAVVGHVRPDGDCIGSQVALCRMLNSVGIESVCVNQDEVPTTLAFLLEDTPFMTGPDFDFAGWDVITVDCADVERTGLKIWPKLPKPMGNIDHHISNTRYGWKNLIEGNSAATGEMLAGFFLDCDYPMDSVTATALYVGIATDTGQFRFPSTTRHTFYLAGILVDRGVDLSEVNRELYEEESIAKLELLQTFLRSFQLHFNGRVCLGQLKEGIYEALGAKPDDSEGLVNYARSIAGVDIGVLAEQRFGKTKASLRAKEKRFRVDLIAKEFNGGGHAAAAGFHYNLPMDELVSRLLEAIGQHLEKVDKGIIG
ncbi:MAG: bifunctional oligoribonuclease/PAP phosphatase NrnA [Opitutae bacterium]|nr:bifunctional oligoribonuclease/PAP phosphatase NrnA [Opitutae bacterium]